ncbi:MAG: magnesium/cobalt efflux protein [Gammaproteobacteria bacterium]|nr:MAG: magnesium/cobalt efflux protein [Gammaproteobacteria bacterium]
MNDEQPPSSAPRKFFANLSGLFSKNNSKEDLREYLQEAQDNKIIDTEEAAMLEGVLAFSEQRVRDVMLPKSKMVTVSEDMSLEAAVRLIIDSGHSRFPVARDEEIVGILLAKDLLNSLFQSDSDFNIADLMRPVHHIPESKPLDVMLREFRRRRLHMAIVTNEYGEIAGLITIEDAIEEIVGEIDDEHDHAEDEDITRLAENQFLVNALTEVEDFNAFFKTSLDRDAHDTIGGFVLSNFGYVPKAGEEISFAGLNFHVKTADDRRIVELLVNR